jgi:hypothetical protein
VQRKLIFLSSVVAVVAVRIEAAAAVLVASTKVAGPTHLDLSMLLLVVVAQVVQHQLQTSVCKELMVEHRASLVVVHLSQLVAVAVAVHMVSALLLKLVATVLH